MSGYTINWGSYLQLGSKSQDMTQAGFVGEEKIVFLCVRHRYTHAVYTSVALKLHGCRGNDTHESKNTFRGNIREKSVQKHWIRDSIL